MIYQQNPYGQNLYNYALQQTQPTPQPQIQMSGFVTVQSEDEARKWGIAPGNSITFKDESAPYIYTKTMGFSQFDTPVFEKYKLVKVEEPKPLPVDNAESNELEEIKKEISAIRSEIAEIKGGLNNE